MNNLFSTGIRPVIDSWLLAKSKEKRDYGSYWSASSAGHCQRRVIFERLGVPKVGSEQDARKQRIFTSGHLFHEWIQGITKKAGLSIAQELELQDEDLMIRGHIDDLVLIDGNLMLIDYKTQNSKAFSYKRPDMSYYHKMQLGTYMYMYRGGMVAPGEKYTATPGNALTEARILKISKDDLRMSEEQLLWSEDLENEIYSYWVGLNLAWEKRIIPPCTCADHEGGFLAKPQWNGYYFEGESCSIKWYEKCKKEGLLK